MLQPQLLKLEEALEEARKAGSTIPDQLQQAILLKCVSGQLRAPCRFKRPQLSKNFVNKFCVGIEANKSGALWFSQKMPRLPRQWRWIEFMTAVDGVVETQKERSLPTTRETRKTKWKAKAKQKMESPVRRASNRKVTTRASTAGKVSQGKGKSSKADMTCHKCGKVGHFARDCWPNSVRNVQVERSQPMQPSPTTTVVGSSSSAASSQMPAVSKQGRVARIQFSDVTQFSDVPRHDDFVFDMRCPSSEAYATDGTVRAVRFYIGDEPNASDSSSEPCNVVRTVIEHVPEECDMHSILLDSGADASIFPASMSELGVPSSVSPSFWGDAQGCSIPLHGMRDVEVHLTFDGHAWALSGFERNSCVGWQDFTAYPVLWKTAWRWHTWLGAHGEVTAWDFGSGKYQSSPCWCDGLLSRHACWMEFECWWCWNRKTLCLMLPGPKPCVSNSVRSEVQNHPYSGSKLMVGHGVVRALDGVIDLSAEFHTFCADHNHWSRASSTGDGF